MNYPLAASSSYIRKPTALIHFERELSVVAQKVMTLIVAHCQKTTKNAQGFYFIEKCQVCEFLGWEESHNYPRVVAAFKEIYNNSLIWNLFGQDRTFLRLECKLIISLLVDEARAIIGFELHPRLEPVIQTPKVFGQILFEVPALLARSEYAFPLYELLADHVSREEGLLRISLADLKRYLGLKGRYSLFSKLKERVLTPSLNTINANTDLQVSYKTSQAGQAVSDLLFRIQRGDQPSPATTSPNATEKALVVRVELPPPLSPTTPAPTWSEEERKLLDRLVRHHISEEEAVQALQTHGLEGTREIFGYVYQEVVRRKGTAEEIRIVSAYLSRCLREGYGLKSSVEREAEQAHAAQVERAAAAQTAAKSAKAAEEQAAAEANTALRAQLDTIMGRFAALPVAKQAALERAFLQAEPFWTRRPPESTMRMKAFERWLAGPGGLSSEIPTTAN